MGALAAVIAAPAAGAKGDVVARLLTPSVGDAPAGATVRVAWTLTTRDENGARRPFSAGAVFVRVIGIRSVRDYPGREWPVGHFRATIRVPPSGIRRLQIGLMGWNDFGPAPLFFRLVGDAQRARSTSAS